MNFYLLVAILSLATALWISEAVDIYTGNDTTDIMREIHALQTQVAQP